MLADIIEKICYHWERMKPDRQNPIGFLCFSVLFCFAFRLWFPQSYTNPKDIPLILWLRQHFPLYLFFLDMLDIWFVTYNSKSPGQHCIPLQLCCPIELLWRCKCSVAMLLDRTDLDCPWNLITWSFFFCLVKKRTLSDLFSPGGNSWV